MVDKLDELKERVDLLNSTVEALKLELEYLKTLKLDIMDARNDIKHAELWTIESLKLLNKISQNNLSTAKLHEKFMEFKNKHNNQEIVIIGTGPSLNDYQPLEGVVSIGLNSAFKKDNLNLDYIFMQDISGMRQYIDDIEQYINKNNTSLFFGR